MNLQPRLLKTSKQINRNQFSKDADFVSSIPHYEFILGLAKSCLFPLQQYAVLFCFPTAYPLKLCLLLQKRVGIITLVLWMEKWRCAALKQSCKHSLVEAVGCLHRFEHAAEGHFKHNIEANLGLDLHVYLQCLKHLKAVIMSIMCRKGVKTFPHLPQSHTFISPHFIPTALMETFLLGLIAA